MLGDHVSSPTSGCPENVLASLAPSSHSARSSMPMTPPMDFTSESLNVAPSALGAGKLVGHAALPHVDSTPCKAFRPQSNAGTPKEGMPVTLPCGHPRAAVHTDSGVRRTKQPSQRQTGSDATSKEASTQEHLCRAPAQLKGPTKRFTRQQSTFHTPKVAGTHSPVSNWGFTLAGMRATKSATRSGMDRDGSQNGNLSKPGFEHARSDTVLAITGETHTTATARVAMHLANAIIDTSRSGRVLVQYGHGSKIAQLMLDECGVF